MRKIQRLAAVGALAGLTVALGACSSAEEPAAPSGGGGTDTGSAAAPESSAAAPSSSASSASSAAPSGDGVTAIEDIFGPACDQVPTEGEGSAQGMVDDPVGTAASNNPLLTTLAETVGAANLVDTLNDPSAQYTVFAPANPAFEAIPPEDLQALLDDPSGDLTTILTYHVIPQRYDAQGLVDAGMVTSVQGGDVTIGGSADAPTIGDQQATVLCGNIPTANATVFVIDQVLMPPAA